MRTNRQTARIAGLLYFLLTVIGIFSIVYVPSRIVVYGDAAGTASNIKAHEMLFRAGIVGDLVCQTLFVFLALTLYHWFKNVDRKYALMLLTLVVVSVPIEFLNTLNQFAPLVLLSGHAYLNVLGTEQLAAISMAALDLHNYGVSVAQVFWGLWLFPFGILVYRSGFLPRTIGVFLMIGCFSILIETFCSLVFPESYGLVSQFTAIPSALGEFSAILWFLIFGARESSPVAAESSSLSPMR
ncbi:MAG: DUF4386 domain-containing protein [Acidobacteriota bacterium]